MKHALMCTGCGLITHDYSLFRCKKCNSLFEVKYDYSKIKLARNFKTARITREKYLPLMPIESFTVRLKEGNTALESRRPKGFGDEILFKIETKNPTHSFKDRGSAVEIARAIELGFDHVCCASTGNMGMSIARYSQSAGIKATIFVGNDVNKEKLKLIKKYGARAVKVRGGFNMAMKSAEQFSRKGGAFVCGDYHYRKEGQKSLMFEVIEQLKYKMPDFIALPVGNATLLAGMYKALQEFRRFSLISKFPRIIAVQSSRCDPLIKAYNSDKPIRYMVSETMADAIAVGYPTFGFEGINALKKTHGLAVNVSDAQIEQAVVNLKQIGIDAEPGGAAGFAGFSKLYNKNIRLFRKKKIVVVITGNNGT